MTQRSITPRNTTTLPDCTLTPAMEDYLKAIYLVGEGGAVTTHALAGYLDVAPPSVTEMVRRLAGEGLVEYTPYRPLSLTNNGVRVASDLVERYRLLVGFLVTILGYADDAVEQEADRLEHAVSERLRACMSEHAHAHDASKGQ